jgi:hypothetical protein
VGNRHIGVAALLVFGFWMITGCATTKKITADILGDEAGLRKKVAFFPGANRSGYGGPELGQALSKGLGDLLTDQCQGMLVSDSAKVRQALEQLPRSASGNVDKLALAELGRVYGLNAVVDPSVSDIRIASEKRGIWGFRDQVSVMRATFLVVVYDIETTAMLFNEIFEEELDLSENSLQEGEEVAKDNREAVNALVARVLPKIQERVCQRLDETPWTGYIVQAEGDRYTLSSGKDVGLSTGQVLEVYKMGDPIEGLEQEVFLVRGPRIGEIRITQVNPDSASAVAVSGSELDNSCCVKVKD